MVTCFFHQQNKYMLSLTLAVLVLFLVVLYYCFKSLYFTLRGPVPGVPPQFLFGNLLQTGLVGENITLNVILLDLKTRFGDIFQFWLGPSRLFVVSRLEDVQHIFAHRHIYDQGDIFTEKISLVNPYALISLKGPAYKRHFSVVSPLFRRNKLNTYLDTIIDCTDKLLIRWRTSYDDSTQVHLNIIEQCQQLLLAIFGHVAFDYDLQTLDDEHNTNKNELADAFYICLDAAFTCVQIPTLVGRLYLLVSLKYRRARSTINRYLQQMIEHELRETTERRAERKRTSLIASLVDSLQRDEKLEAKKSDENKQGLSRDEVIADMLLLLSAGYGSTSAALVWFIFFMSKHPHIQNKLKNELSQYERQRLTIEQLDSFIYLDSVLREVFRLTPPVAGTIRTLTTDDQLPATGAHLRKGDHVLIPFYNLNRDKRYCPGSTSPEEFHPERFLIETTEKNNNLMPIAFGGGHRQCIGQDFARLELKAICVRLMQHVRFGDGGEKVNAGGYKQTDTILPKQIGVTITFD